MILNKSRMIMRLVKKSNTENSLEKTMQKLAVNPVARWTTLRLRPAQMNSTTSNLSLIRTISLLENR